MRSLGNIEQWTEICCGSSRCSFRTLSSLEKKHDADAFGHYGATIAVVVTPRNCGRCHKTETDEFMASHHAKAGNILASLGNFLAETVEG